MAKTKSPPARPAGFHIQRDRYLLQWLADGHGQLRQAFDFALELVTGHSRRDAGRRASHDDVAAFERDHLRQLGDDLGHVPDHLREIAVLADLAVALERDLALARMAGLARGLQRTARCR